MFSLCSRLLQLVLNCFRMLCVFFWMWFGCFALLRLFRLCSVGYYCFFMLFSVVLVVSGCVRLCQVVFDCVVLGSPGCLALGCFDSFLVV